MALIANSFADFRKAMLFAGFAGIALVTARSLVLLLDGSFHSVSWAAQGLFLANGSLFAAALAILIWCRNSAMVPLTVAWVAAVVGGFVGFTGLLFVMADAANWLIFVGSMLVTMSLGFFCREAFDRMRRRSE